MAVETLILAVNPGSSSRRYAFYKKDKLLASLHFEYENDQIVCTVNAAQSTKKITPPIAKLEDAPAQVMTIIEQAGIAKDANITCIGLRVVAPTVFFLQDHILNDDILAKLKSLKQRVPLHIGATLQEAEHLKQSFKGIPIVLISDSAFHATKPDYAWNYAIHLEDADRLEIKRFGYHGISLSSVVYKLEMQNKLLEKTIICHLGSGSSITAVLNGKSIDTSMGYSPLEGMIMATRSGPLDVVAALSLKKALGLNDVEFEDYLNTSSGLRGISGESSDIRILLSNESKGDYRAGLALRMFIYKARQAIGQMAAALDGADCLVFTGTVGERSHKIRKRIVEKLSYLGFVINDDLNNKTIEPSDISIINPRTRNKPVYVICCDEASEIARRAFICARL
jgi:acetate kinase